MKAEYRNIDSSPGSSFKARLFNETEFPAAWHFHPQYELTYILESTGIRYVGDSIQNFEKGDLVLVGPNLPHCWMTVGEQTSEVKCIIVQWDPDLIGTLLEKPEVRHISTLFKLSQRGVRFNLEVSKKVKNVLLDVTKAPPFEGLLQLFKGLNELALSQDFELLASSQYNNAVSMDDSDRINTIYNYVKNQHLNQITLGEAAQEVFMGKEAFCRFFKKTFNKTFFSFVNEYKINLASKLLINTDKTVSEIGYSIGYNNLSFFYRQFNKFMKMSPSQYRKTYRKILI